MKVNSAYKYIFEILSDNLGLDIVTIEELILDCPSVSLLCGYYLADVGMMQLLTCLNVTFLGSYPL